MNKKENSSWLIRFLDKKLANSGLQPDQKRQLIYGLDITANLITVVGLVLLMRTYIISPFQVYGISMCNTLNFYNGSCQDTYGDYIIINKAAYLRLPGYTVGTPQRGDIIVFHPPIDAKQFYIKRVIGLPGETVKLIDGFVYVYNKKYPMGVKLDEPYLNSENLGSTFATGGISEFTVPEGKYFVMGDNRQHSSDSRICFKESPAGGGCEQAGNSSYITPDLIEGKAAVSLWPNPRILITHSYSAFSK